MGVLLEDSGHIPLILQPTYTSFLPPSATLSSLSVEQGQSVASGAGVYQVYQFCLGLGRHRAVRIMGIRVEVVWTEDTHAFKTRKITFTPISCLEQFRASTSALGELHGVEVLGAGSQTVSAHMRMSFNLLEELDRHVPNSLSSFCRSCHGVWMEDTDTCVAGDWSGNTTHHVAPQPSRHQTDPTTGEALDRPLKPTLHKIDTDMEFMNTIASYALWTALGLAILAVLIFLSRRYKSRSRQNSTVLDLTNTSDQPDKSGEASEVVL